MSSSRENFFYGFSIALIFCCIGGLVSYFVYEKINAENFEMKQTSVDVFANFTLAKFVDVIANGKGNGQKPSI